MDVLFIKSLNEFLEYWEKSSLSSFEKMISEDYKAREIRNGAIVDFGYEESIKGWKEGFTYVLRNRAFWDIKKIFMFPLNSEEVLVCLVATIVTNDHDINTANIFFETFRKETSNEWKLVRSYIEAGVPNEYLSALHLFNENTIID